MEIILIKDRWIIEDKNQFNEYLKSFSKGIDSCEKEKRILNTNYDCIAVSSVKVDNIIKNILKGNYLSFIDLWNNDNNTSLVITGKLIAKIKDFDIFKKYLLKYLTYVDSWAHTDALKLMIKESEQDKFFDLTCELIKDLRPFFRRMGLIILFKLINEKYIDSILKICDSLYDEQNYYVNMANAWLVAECFAKFKDKTLVLIQNKTLNKFTQNKAISKCHDSFRVDKNDSEMLKKYRL